MNTELVINEIKRKVEKLWQLVHQRVVSPGGQSRVELRDLADVESSGFLYTAGKTLRGNGTKYASATLKHSDLSLDDGENPHGTDFLDLQDTPSSYSGYAKKVCAVNSAETVLEFVDSVPVFRDHFIEAPNLLAATTFSKAYWTGGGVNGIQQIIEGTNGLMQIKTTNVGGSSSFMKFNNRCTDNDRLPIFETYLYVDALTNRKIEFGLYDDIGNDYIFFRFDTDVSASNIYLVTKNNEAAEVVEDTGIDLTAGVYFKFRIQIYADDTFDVFINGSEVIPAHVGTIRDVSFKFYFYQDNRAAAQDNFIIIDYVDFYQNI